MFSVPWGGFYSYSCLRIFTCVVSESCHTRTSHVAYEWVMMHTHRSTLKYGETLECICYECDLVCVCRDSFMCDMSRMRLWRQQCSTAFVMSVILRVCVVRDECDSACVCHDTFICDMTRMQMLRHGKCWHAYVMSVILCVCVPWLIHMRHDSNAKVTTWEMLKCSCHVAYRFISHINESWRIHTESYWNEGKR